MFPKQQRQAEINKGDRSLGRSRGKSAFPAELANSVMRELVKLGARVYAHPADPSLQTARLGKWPLLYQPLARLQHAGHV